MRPVVALTLSKSNHVSQKKVGEATIRSCFTKLWTLRPCLLLMGSAYLTVLTSLALCSDQPDASPASTSAAQNASVAGLTKRPATVADSIQMTRLGDSSYT